MPEFQEVSSALHDLRIGAYRIVRTLDVTSTTEVLLAVSEGPLGFERTVVIKRVTPGSHDPIVLQSLAREAVAYARLNHAAIVRLYDFFEVDNRPVMVLEYVDGTSLAKLLSSPWLQGQKLPEDAALHVGERIFAALEAAHAARDPKTNEFAPVIHRDVCPGNVLITRDGDVKLSDFGLAKLVGASPKDTVGSGMMTAALGYMAPEQMLGQAVTVRADVYAGALVLREMLTGQVAFPRGGTALAYLQKMVNPELSPIDEHCPSLPTEVKTALTVALEANAEARAITAAEMHRVLRAANAGRAGQRALAESQENLSAAPPASEVRVIAATDSFTPHPMVLVEPEPVPPEPPRASRVSRTPALAMLLLACVVTALAAVLVARSARPGLRAQAVPSARAALPPAAVVVPPPPPAPPLPPPEPAPVATTGEISTPGAPSHRRVFIDGKPAGNTGEALTVACGAHKVKVGSSGIQQSVEVPCGGAIVVDAR